MDPRINRRGRKSAYSVPMCRGKTWRRDSVRPFSRQRPGNRLAGRNAHSTSSQVFTRRARNDRRGGSTVLKKRKRGKEVERNREWR